jgi:starch phosphorylase
VLKEYYEAGTTADYLNRSINNLCLNVPVFNTHRLAAEYLQRYRLQLPEAQMAQMAAYAQLYSSDN